MTARPVASLPEDGRHQVRSAGASPLSQLSTDGFAIVPGPFAASELHDVSRAYDTAVAMSDAADVKQGATSVRVDGLLRLQPGLAAIYRHPPLLAAAREVIASGFKLSAFHARSVRPRAAAQRLHRDFLPLADGWPMVGFIFMVDAFDAENGATRFVVESQRLGRLPEPAACDPRVSLACGAAGSMILFNGSVWHGHGPNSTDRPRRSLQGALIRHDQSPADASLAHLAL